MEQNSLLRISLPVFLSTPYVSALGDITYIRVIFSVCNHDTVLAELDQGCLLLEGQFSGAEFIWRNHMNSQVTHRLARCELGGVLTSDSGTQRDLIGREWRSRAAYRDCVQSRVPIVQGVSPH